MNVILQTLQTVHVVQYDSVGGRDWVGIVTQKILGTTQARIASQNFYRSRPEIFSNLVSIIWLSRFLMIFAFFHFGSRPDWVATQKKIRVATRAPVTTHEKSGSRPELGRDRESVRPTRSITPNTSLCANKKIFSSFKMKLKINF